jgi:hypothetical protein
MICNDPRCQDKSPHDWGDDGCEKPTFLCSNCEEYFDKFVEKVTQKWTPYQEEVVSFFCPECCSEDFTTMHGLFSQGDKVVVLDGDLLAWFRGEITEELSEENGDYRVKVESSSNSIDYYFDNVFSQTKSGYLKLSERLESQRAALKDAIDLADDEIKKIEEEEKCQDR